MLSPHHCALYFSDDLWTLYAHVYNNPNEESNAVEKKQPWMVYDRMRYFCSKCPRSYKYKQDLKRHMNLECDIEPQFSCPLCPKKCKRKTHLRNHIMNKHKCLAVDVKKMTAHLNAN